MWWRLLWWVISFAISDYFRQRLPAQTPSGIGDFNIPTATEGRSVPIIPGGTPRIRAPNCIHYSDFAAVERTVTTGVIFKEEETIGFTYELALVYALFKGEAAGITGIWIGEDKVFDHVADAAGVPQTVVDIDRDDLFGGVDDGGGFVGRVRLFNGAEDQAASSFLQARVPTTPAYRGTCYVVITDPTETKGANIGEAPNLRHITYEVQAFDTVANGGLGDVLGLANNTHFIGPDANPISVAYDLWTNQRWGRRRPLDEVNAVNFAAVAATIHAEGLGFTMLIDEQTTTDEIQDIIEQHIDGYIGPNPLTGKIEVKLARPDYVLANVYQVDASNLRGIPKWNKGDWSQTFNRVRIRYTDRAKDWNETHAVEVAPGNRIIQGATLTKEVRYQGCHTAEVASKLAAREKRNLAQPSSSGQIEIDRTAWEQRPGDVMSFTSLKVFEADLAVRITKAQVGNVVDNTMVFDVVADIFGPEISTSIIPPVTDFVPPIQAVEVLLAADQAAFESPFVLMQYDAQPDTIPRITTLARKASGSPTEYEVIRRVRAVAGGGSYGSFASSGFIRAGFTQCGTLRAALPGWTSGNGAFSIEVDPIGSESLDNLIGQYSPGIGNAGGLCIIGPGTATEEWFATSEIIDDGAGISLENVYRSCMDTAMLSHALGARVWFVWTGGMGMPIETYDAGNGVEVKLLPRSPTDAITEPEATALPEVAILDTIRHARPLLPRTLNINDTEFPTTTVDADFAAETEPTVNGIRFDVFPRVWNAADVLDQVKGNDVTGAPITDADWLARDVNVEYWLYDLDSTPTPVRDTDDIITGTLAWNTVLKAFVIPREDLILAGITADFEARIEIEIDHSPAGETANQISRAPMFFDFDVTGTFAAVGFAFGEIAFHSNFNGLDAAVTTVDNSWQNATIAFVGNAQIDTAQSKFGGSSLLLDGTGDYVTVPTHASLNFGTGDYTVEFQMRINALNTFNIMSWSTGVQAVFYMLSGTGQLVFWHGGFDRIIGGSLTTATWYHIAVVRSAGVHELFIDGVSIGTNSAAAAFSQAPFEVGRRAGAAQEFNGWIDEVRIINGTAVYTEAFTPPTAPFEFRTLAFMSGFDGADAATALNELSRNAAALTFVGNAQLDTAQSKFGASSLLLDGTGDYVSSPDQTDLDLFANNFTIECQVRFNGDPGTAQMAFVSKWTEAGNQRSWYAGLRNNQLVFFHSTNGSAGIATLAENWNPVGSVWYHIAFVREGGVMRVFVDGVQLGTDDATISTAVLWPNTGALWVGAFEGAGSDYLNGWIDEVRIMNGVAVYTENFAAPTEPFEFERVAFLAGFDGADAAAVYTSEDKLHQDATFAGNAQLDTAQSKFGASSLLLDGTGDYVSFPDHLAFALRTSIPFTVECFVRFNGDPGTGTMAMLAQLNPSASARAWTMRLTNNLLEWVYSTNGSNGLVINRTWNPAGDTWYHVAVSYDGTNIRFFVDGVKLGGDTAHANTYPNIAQPMSVGALADGTNLLNGWIDEARVTAGKAIYTANFTPPLAPFPRQ